jgi:glycerol-3-phosphate dehydrogenase (NAD(P)+)
MTTAAVIGTTSWGTTLAVLLARNGAPVRMLTRDGAEADALNRDRENKRFAPGVTLPEAVTATSSPADALTGADLVMVAVPSRSIRENMARIAADVPLGATVVSATKGLEISSGKRMSEVIAGELGPGWKGHICALSGPNLAREVLSGLPSTTVVAGSNDEAMARVQAAFSSQSFRVYTNADLVGVELGGALKNIIAIGAGICDGLQLGDNAKAAFVTRGLAEIARLGVASGAAPLTLAGLAGMGDLVATCYSDLSRNHHVGIELAAGRDLEDIRAEMDNVAEGVDTTAAAVRLAERLSVDMPIARAINSILFEGVSLESAISELLGRRPAPEWSGLDGGKGY